VVVSKSVEYIQTAPNRVDPAPIPNGFGFAADVNGFLPGPSIAGIPAPVLTGPINTAALGANHNNGRLVYRAGDNGWRWGQSANDFGGSSAAIRDSLFGNGTYNIAVNGTTVTLRLTGDQYPNVPQLALTGGAWIGDAYVIDTDKALTITTNEYTAYGTHVDDLICVALFGGQFTFAFEEIAPFGCDGNAFGNIPLASRFARTSPGTKTASLTIPANTPRDGVEYLLIGIFEAIVDDQPNAALPGSRNVAAYQTNTILRVVAQLNSSGQLQAANLTSLTAAVTGLLASAGSSVAVIPPGTSIASVGGTTLAASRSPARTRRRDLRRKRARCS